MDQLRRRANGHPCWCVAAAARRWEEAERHFGRTEVAKQMRNRSGWPTWAAYRPGCCWIEAGKATPSGLPRYKGFVRLLHVWHACLRC